ncbi:MAG: serine acetyltransferase [Bacteroidales bacterium]|nr:serine acetyltransferase [Bacteroidales bacterium]
MLGLDIHYNTQIGAGFVLHHPFNIAINGNAVLGENCSLYHGCTIGAELRGKRAGCPTLGNSVWVGSNACIVGDIHIGNDVLIAPLTFVNFDIPDHSIVVGNPARIIHRDHATEKYII